ncbi:MAG: hypothetical protein H7835_17375 [Magnetococcus sp. XQGC-1]
MSGFALRSGWFSFGPEFDLPDDFPPRERGGAERPVPVDPAWFMPPPADAEAVSPGARREERSDEQGLYAQIRRLDAFPAEEAAALISAFAGLE